MRVLPRRGLKIATIAIDLVIDLVIVLVLDRGARVAIDPMAPR